MKYGNIIFLDCDGVINSQEWYKLTYYKGLIGKPEQDVCPYMVGRVLDICRECDARIVISSSWRGYDLKDTMERLGDYKELLGEEFMCYIVDSTPRVGICRGDEIKEWLNNNECERYVIIDDDSDMLDEQLPCFVQTDNKYGLTNVEKELAIKILKK